MMNDADVIEGIEALCEAALGRDDEQSVALTEILRLIRRRKSERILQRQPLVELIRPRTDPMPGEDH